MCCHIVRLTSDRSGEPCNPTTSSTSNATGTNLQFQALFGHHTVVFDLCGTAGKKLRCVENGSWTDANWVGSTHRLTTHVLIPRP
ncbi:hypothetical protein M441DRAFT_146464 [Trichoderma asperellum CBS 433.97]|uniref:Uncharacterized protein n=1 Tax=Trichoderma asperellum (strain ATCC 204424 / CBS 433.97 / NBRC 101777) TaxID=1042311 RepID=A0A2T3Z075_TRIA4|nr:hypothetical protein M441DRAFT_146464 [Trichoderma asperellum CBS 433.97]PTB38195.1 hypothetical protein M441DRAFT_146464 [Trichoderma asperellum CBS 433.97]